MSIRRILEEVGEEIRVAARGAGRDPSSVSLIGVTKTHTAETVMEAYEAGLRHFGESYIQEALPKIDLVPGDAKWHMIGRLQSNKAKLAVGAFSLIHTLDRPSLAEELNKAALQRGLRVPVLLQVSLAGEATKSGAAPGDTITLARRASEWPALEIRGLMTIPPFDEDPEMTRKYFRALRELRDNIESMALLGVKMDHLSMGMSHDFRVAVEEGATLVRVGSRIFGQRG